MKTLRALREELQAHGGELLVVDCLPRDAFARILEACRAEGGSPPALVTWNRDYEPFARHRDAELEAFLKAKGVIVATQRDHLLFEPHEVSKGGGGFYQVYTPFSRKWFELLASPEGEERIATQSSSVRYFDRKGKRADLFRARWKDIFERVPLADALEDFARQNEPRVTVPIPEAGFSAAFGALRRFEPKLSRYKEGRDYPALTSTSRLSLYFKNGSLTIAQVIHALRLDRVEGESSSGPTQYLRELAWREFYYSILFHRPDVEHQSFLPQYRELAWRDDPASFERWKTGTTGFPIVDAGMRELLTTGWMHNRVRMIVASFLTKDLLIDWRLGERHFMQLLLDGDLAVNNGGWQWAASTGCDPQPYFRVFNPWLQGEKFDPDGRYIRAFLPELRNAPLTALHSPDFDRKPFGYPDPIVDHSSARNRAIALYKR